MPSLTSLMSGGYDPAEERYDYLDWQPEDEEPLGDPITEADTDGVRWFSDANIHAAPGGEDLIYAPPATIVDDDELPF